VTGYLTYDANTARLDDLHRRAGRRLAVRNAVTQTAARDAPRVRADRPRATASARRRRPRWSYRAA
jgi:hypothetical protein